MRLGWIGLLAVLAAGAQDWPGGRPDGTVLLTNGWALSPHGRQIDLPSDLPVRMALHPDGRHLAVQHVGLRAHQVAVVDTHDGRVVASLPLERSWSGLAWSPDGATLYVSGGVDDTVHAFAGPAALAGRAEAQPSLAVGAEGRLDLVAGLACDARGRLFCCLQRSGKLVRVAGGKVEATFDLPADSFSFECLVAPDGRTVYVSLWNRAEVVGLDAETGAITRRLATGQHPSEMLVSPDGRRLFVSNGNENSVTAIDLAAGEIQETIGSALWAGAPPGSTPNSVALTADGRTLVIANADNNNLAVVDVSRPGRARGLGYIPTGWYPTSVRLVGDTAWVANGKGSAGSRPNDGGIPAGAVPTVREYIGGLFGGSLSTFPMPAGPELATLSQRAYANAPLRADAGVRGLPERPADSPIPARPGDPSPIRHVVYIIKENRTYDQVFGDLERGNGDPRLCLFGREVTPNHHAIAEEFVQLDNFYVESEVSADGHEWTVGAYATDFVERTWPVTYGGRGDASLGAGLRGSLGYPSEGGFALATPKNGYLWDLCRAAGVSYRSYGEFIDNPARRGEPATTRVPGLEGHFDPYFWGYDLSVSDQDRADRFIEELLRFQAEGEYPALTILRLPNDHTAGTSPGRPTPRAMVADNDLALGRVLEALSWTSFWSSMVVFVVEDDAQNGPDHVDAHRSIGLVAGPYVRRGALVSTQYSTCSMLRTIELILGLPPMSQFDAAARPMYDCFQSTPIAGPYRRRPNTWPLDELNPATAWGAELSQRMNLAREDQADDLLFGEVIWRSVHGADSPMPRPVRAAFVRALADGDADDDD